MNFFSKIFWDQIVTKAIAFGWQINVKHYITFISFTLQFLLIYSFPGDVFLFEFKSSVNNEDIFVLIF